jgi:hypothetical protein
MNTHFLNKRMAHQLGLLGLLPFVALTLACWFVDSSWLGDFIKGQLVYGILILSFLGGIHWGGTMVSDELTAEQTKKTMAWSVVPALAAWFATMVGGFGFAVLIVGFIVTYQIDKKIFSWYRFPDWFIRLRFVLTCVVVAALALTVIAANVRG